MAKVQAARPPVSGPGGAVAKTSRKRGYRGVRSASGTFVLVEPAVKPKRFTVEQAREAVRKVLARQGKES
jgi:hypothetical protein